MSKMEDLVSGMKLGELLHKKEDDKKNKLVWTLAIVGAVAAIAGIAYAVYKYLTPDYEDDFDDDFDNEFDDDFFGDDEDDIDEDEIEAVESTSNTK